MKEQMEYFFVTMQVAISDGAKPLEAIEKALRDTADVWNWWPKTRPPLPSVAADEWDTVDKLPGKVESGYLIERSNQGYPEYLYVSGEIFNWTRSAIEGIRFCRRVDAEQVAAVIGEDVDRICQHQWGPDR